MEIVFIKHTDDSVVYACAGNNSEGHESDMVELRVIGKMNIEIINVLTFIEYNT